jgi:hypothetical protein
MNVRFLPSDLKPESESINAPNAAERVNTAFDGSGA